VFGLVNRFIGSSIVVTTISSYTLKITVTIAHVTSHEESSNSSSGQAAVPLELRNSSSEVNSHSRILSHPLGTDHTQKTQFYCRVAQTIQKTSHVITISPVHWLADCCLETSYKHSSYCCVRKTWGVYRGVAWKYVDISQYLLHIEVTPIKFIFLKNKFVHKELTFLVSNFHLHSKCTYKY
jgi:hypothetical protein